jgi:phenylacetate-CoA ligase
MKSIAEIVYPFAERYVGRDISSKVGVLTHRYTLAPDVRARLRIFELIETLEYARTHVPYYRELLSGLNPTDLERKPELIAEIPILTKEIILGQGDRMISDELRGQFLHERKTGGSTGKAVALFYSQEDLDWTAAVNLSLSQFTGRKMSDREIHLSADFDDKTTFINRVYSLVKSIAMNRRNIFVRDIAPQALSRLLDQLHGSGADLIQSHPSTMFALAEFVSSSKPRKKTLFRRFESTGEMLTPLQERRIRETLGCRVFNRYGSAEFGVVAHSSVDPFVLHLIDAVAHPESVFRNGVNELVLTGLRRKAMPLIRYATGDCASIRTGASGVELFQMEGRVHESVKVKGRPVLTHYLQDVLDRCGAHLEFQLLYEEGTAELKKILIVPRGGAPEKQRVELEVEKHLGARIPVTYTGFEGLVKVGSREKFRRAVPEPVSEN